MKLDIEALAKEVGLHYPMTPLTDDAASEYNHAVRRFAELVEAVTREDCALTCEARFAETMPINGRMFAAAIRALKSA